MSESTPSGVIETMLLTDQEVLKLGLTKNEEEWNQTCDEIKAARQGRYPEDWFTEVLASGFAHAVMKSWNKP